MTDSVIQLKFRTPPNADFKYLPGQYINLSYKGVVRPYSIAGTNARNDEIELHVKNYLGGKMSALLFDKLRKDTLMRINGPHGTFFLQESARPLVFLVTGTGFAPVKAILERFLEKSSARNIMLFWGAKTEKDHYMNEPNEWMKEYSQFSYYPVVSQPSSAWKGYSGYVQDVFERMVDNVPDYDVYACGSVNMIDSAKSLLVAKGLDESNFFSDAFLIA